MTERFKQEVLSAFQKVSPSSIAIEDAQMLERYTTNHRRLFFRKLRFPPELFKGQRIIDFGCGTGEVDVVLAQWGGNVEGFDFNPVSIERATYLAERFGLTDRLTFSVGDVDSAEIGDAPFDIAVSFGVIAHVPDQRRLFDRMVGATRRGGYLILGYVEDAGLIERLLHRAIVQANADKSQEEIFRIAQTYFAEHIDRSVRYGGRTAASVINDYLINPHYVGLSSHDLAAWATEHGLEFYSTWPNTDLPFVVDSPYFEPLSRSSSIYRLFVSLNRLRWVFAQAEDAVVFGELQQALEGLGQRIETFLHDLTDVLQQASFSESNLEGIRDSLAAVSSGVAQAGTAVNAYACQHLETLGGELERVLTLIVRKTQDGAEFDLAEVSGALFKGYNGLGTSYTVFHKPR